MGEGNNHIELITSEMLSLKLGVVFSGQHAAIDQSVAITPFWNSLENLCHVLLTNVGGGKYHHLMQEFDFRENTKLLGPVYGK